MAEAEEYLDVEQIQGMLGVSRATVWNILNRYDLERFHIPARGKRTLVRKSDLLRVREQPVPARRRRGQTVPEGKLAA